MVSNKQQSYVGKSQKADRKAWNTVNFYADELRPKQKRHRHFLVSGG